MPRGPFAKAPHLRPEGRRLNGALFVVLATKANREKQLSEQHRGKYGDVDHQ
jgi:hypothetical protein